MAWFMNGTDTCLLSSINNNVVREGIERCPFLRNINKPTGFSFSPSAGFCFPAAGARGPIFEDGPNFEMAFKLFHGPNGVVPLSGRSNFVHNEIDESEHSVVQFNPLAAKAATTSLSSFGFGPGVSFGFDFLAKKLKKQKNKNEPQGGNNSQHESMSNEWLETGQCPIAKSYRAVSGVLPLVAKALQPPPGVKLRCPQAVVAVRAALARTALAKNLRPQPLPTKMLAIALLGMAVNVPLGMWREHTQKFSFQWFVAVHTAIPFIAILRKAILMPKTAMAITLAASILGQAIGSKAERLRIMAATPPSAIVSVEKSFDDLKESPQCAKMGTLWQSLPQVKPGSVKPPSYKTEVCF